MKKLLVAILLLLSAGSAADDVYGLQIPCFDAANHEAAFECLNPDIAVTKYIGQHVQVVKAELYVDENKWPSYSIAYYVRRDR